MGHTVPPRECGRTSRHYRGTILTVYPDPALSCMRQMFTDFVAECRAESLKARLTEAAVDTSTIRQKEPVLEEAPERIAVVA